MVCFTLVGSYTVWLLLRFVVGLSATVLFVLSEFWIATWAPDRRRGFVIGLYVTALAAGFAIGPLILVATGTAGNLPFYLGGALLLGSAIPLALNARDAPHLAARSGRSFWSLVRDTPEATLAALLHGAIEIAGLSLLPVYALRAGLDARHGALFACLFIVGSSALQVPIGALADRVDRCRLLLVLAVFGLVGAILLAVFGVTALLLFEALLLPWGAVVGAFYPVGLGDISSRFTGADLARANTAYVMTYAAGMMIGPPIVGEGLDLMPPSGFFWSIAALIGAYLIAIRPSRKPAPRARFS